LNLNQFTPFNMSKLDDVQLVETVTTNMEAKPMATVDFRISLPDELIHLSLEEQNELEKRIVRKMDRRLMPIIIVMYVVWL
jgi:hypothetical protein